MIQHRAARIVLNKPWNRHHRDSIIDMLNELNWPSLQECRKQARLILLYKIVNNLLLVPNRCLPSLKLIKLLQEPIMIRNLIIYNLQ